MDTPQVILEHYLTQLKLPTMLREYVKLAEQCAKEGGGLSTFPASSGGGGDAGAGPAGDGAAD